MKLASHPWRSFGPGIRAIFASLLIGLALLYGDRAFASGGTSTPSGAEPDESSTSAYLTLGLGGSTVGLMTMVGLSLENGSLLISARKGATGTFEPIDPSKVVVTDYSLLVGKTWQRHGTRLYAEAGLGLAEITRRGDLVEPGTGDTFAPYYRMSSDKALNVSFQAGAREDWSFIGLGLAVVGNVNSGLSEVGLALTVSLGKMHD